MHEDPLKKKLRAYFTKQEKEVQDNLVAFGSKNIQDDIDDILNEPGIAIESAIELITPMIQQYIEDSGGQAMELIGSGLDFDGTTESIRAWIEERAKFFAESINKTTQDELFKTLAEGLKNNETVDALSERVAEVYGQARDFRTDRIARTEISAAANAGSKEAFLQAGVEKWEWQVVDPDDADCYDNEGVIVNIGDPFPSGVTEPPVHPNCQCTTTPVFDGEE